jgi:hypothetical protein
MPSGNICTRGSPSSLGGAPDPRGAIVLYGPRGFSSSGVPMPAHGGDHISCAGCARKYRPHPFVPGQFAQDHFASPLASSCMVYQS